ncbi:MAG: D-glycero-beta-D-manno-heptose 1-phosphate adenylyltransferase [Bacteroidales bacterium]|nr:D-glycero-beta-D-manno-heptose 1-phosphate adenylyltransferase [Bacteroidales bacterium]
MSRLHPNLDIEQKIVSRAFFVENAVKLHQQKIVFTNGCFDVLHFGHVHYLLQAKELGDILVVGLNSDDSVRRLKGPSRPINGEKERAFVLAALTCVDYVVVFEEDTPKELIETVRPDVLVKGGDYALDQIVGADFVTRNGGSVTTLPFVEGFSSTRIIEQLKTE